MKMEIPLRDAPSVSERAIWGPAVMRVAAHGKIDFIQVGSARGAGTWGAPPHRG